MKYLFSPELSGKEQLQQLLVLRLFYLITEVAVLAISQYQSAMQLPWGYLWLVVLFHGITVVGYYLNRRSQSDVSEIIIFQTILADILFFSGLFYFSGGASNGAVSLLLLPVATAAALFRWRFALALAIAAILSYSLLMWFSYPIAGAIVDGGHSEHMHHASMQNSGFTTHLWVMWATFVFSCLLLVWFIGLQSAAVRQKQKSLAQLRENQLRDEQLIAIATFAANAAHDLATPLSSISLLCDELKEELTDETTAHGLQQNIDTLIGEVQLCRDIVQSISHQAIQNKDNLRQSKPIRAYFDALVSRWLVTRADIVLDYRLEDSVNHNSFKPDTSIESAITNILDNAAQASIINGANDMALNIKCQGQEVIIELIDNGEGIDEQTLAVLGKEPVKSTQQGMGLGQFLANSSIQRFGGSVWRQTTTQGTQTIISLPIESQP